MTLVNLIAVLTFLLIALSTPLRVGLVFVRVAGLGSACAGQIRGLVGLLGFLIYVGGALVLFGYCFMLSPLVADRGGVGWWVVVGLITAGSMAPSPRGAPYEFYWRGCLLLAVGLILFLVIISVVSLVDLNSGSLRA